MKTKYMVRQAESGFTLVEVLLAIGLVAALSSLAVVAINPAYKFKQARDTQRSSDVASIAGVVQQYYIDNQGKLPLGLTTSDQGLKKSGGLDLCATLVPKYLTAMPADPKTTPVADCAASYDTGYLIRQETGSDRVIVSAPGYEAASSIITATR